jgi:hypothetical protein
MQITTRPEQVRFDVTPPRWKDWPVGQQGEAIAYFMRALPCVEVRATRAELVLYVLVPEDVDLQAMRRRVDDAREQIETAHEINLENFVQKVGAKSTGMVAHDLSIHQHVSRLWDYLAREDTCKLLGHDPEAVIDSAIIALREYRIGNECLAAWMRDSLPEDLKTFAGLPWERAVAAMRLLAERRG